MAEEFRHFGNCSAAQSRQRKTYRDKKCSVPTRARRSNPARFFAAYSVEKHRCGLRRIQPIPKFTPSHPIAQMSRNRSGYVEFEELYNDIRTKVCRLLDGVKQEMNLQLQVNVKAVSVSSQQVRQQATSTLHTPLLTFDGKSEN